MPRNHNDSKFSNYGFDIGSDIMERTMKAEDISRLDGFERR